MDIGNIQPGSERDRAVGAFVGLAVGDALGAPLKFATRDTLRPVTDLVGGGPFGLRPGEWSDATGMALCLADSILGYQMMEWDLMDRFRQWWLDGRYTVSGKCPDISDAMRWSLGEFVQDEAVETDDIQATKDGTTVNDTRSRHSSNDSLKRLAPVAVRWCRSLRSLESAAGRQNATTHRGAEPEEACVFYAQLLYEAILERPIEDVLRSRKSNTEGRVAELVAGSWRDKTRDDVQSTECVVHTLEAALWAIAYGSTSQPLFVTDVSPFRQSVLAAVNLGGDANSVGAVTGQLAGALWGLSGIPRNWVKAIAQSERLIELAKDLYDPDRLEVGDGWRRNPDFVPDDYLF